jgi:hypothetical protein
MKRISKPFATRQGRRAMKTDRAAAIGELSRLYAVSLWRTCSRKFLSLLTGQSDA